MCESACVCVCGLRILDLCLNQVLVKSSSAQFVFVGVFMFVCAAPERGLVIILQLLPHLFFCELGQVSGLQDHNDRLRQLRITHRDAFLCV